MSCGEGITSFPHDLLPYVPIQLSPDFRCRYQSNHACASMPIDSDYDVSKRVAAIDTTNWTTLR